MVSEQEEGMTGIEVSALTLADHVLGEDAEETSAFREMLLEAKEYVSSQRWCHAILASYFGVGVGGLCAAWLFRLEVDEGVDDWLWVVNGDLPSVYLVCDKVERPVDALRLYCDIMESWIKAVRSGADVTNEFPVDAPATEEITRMLQKRVEILRKEIIPNFE